MKLLKNLKSLKNLKKSKLAKAVAMSLIVSGGVMGVCGSALAKYDYVSREERNLSAVWTGEKDPDISWLEGAEGKDNATSNNYVTITGGKIENVYCARSQVEVFNSTLRISGGQISEAAYAGINRYYNSNKYDPDDQCHVHSNTLIVEEQGFANIVYGGRSNYGIVEYNTVNVIGSGGVNNAYGGLSLNKEAKFNNVKIENGGIINNDVYGGKSEKANAKNNTVNVIGGVVKGVIYGGRSDHESANDNQVRLSGGTVGTVYGGYAPEGRTLRNKIVIAAPTTIGDIYGGYGKLSDLYDDNTLIVQAVNSTAKSINNMQSMHFDKFDNAQDGDVLLNVSGQIDLNGLEYIGVRYDTYKTDTTVTLLSSPNTDFTKLDRSKLKLFGEGWEPAEEKAVEVAGLNKSIGAAVGYDITKNALNFTTKYQLKDDLDVAEDITLNGQLDLNGKTVNMQQKPEEAALYNTLTAKKLIGDGNLKIDVDLKNGINDKLYISGSEDNAATININSIIVREDLPSTLDGLQEETGKVTIIEGDNLNGITLNVADNKLRTATSKYIYTFTTGEAGKLNYTQILPGVFSEFIGAEGKYKNVDTLVLTEDEVADKDLGQLKSRLNGSNNVTLNFKEGISLSGKEKDKNYEGVTVENGLTFNLKGKNGENPGKVTDFKDYAVKNKGTLNIENLTFENNKTAKGVATDIVNEDTGVVNFDGTNTITAISNAGTVNLKGANSITALTGKGNTTIESGKTTIGRTEQNNVEIKNGAEAVLKNVTIKDTLTNNGNAQATRVQGTALKNNGDILAYAENSFTTVSGQGTFRVNGWWTTVNGAFEQNKVIVGGGLVLKGDALIKNVTVGNYGLFEANNIEISEALINDGDLNFKGDAKLAKVNNGKQKPSSKFNVKAENKTVTVDGEFKQKTVNVDAGTLVLNGSSNATDLTINSKGALEIGGTLELTNGLKNDGAVTMKSANNLPSVEGKGTFNVKAGATAVEKAFVQNTLNVSGGELELKAIGDSFDGASVQVNTVNVSGGKVKGNLAGNTVNLSGGTVTGTVYGGSTVADANNVLNVSGSNIQAGNIANFQELNFTLSKDINEDVAMLNLKDATATSLGKTTINTNVDIYTLETTVTLLNAPNLTDIADDKLKINGKSTENKTMIADKAVDGLSEAIGVAVGYDVSKQALKLTTNSYKLLENTGVTKDVDLKRELDLNGKTLNMQRDSYDNDSYNYKTLTVKNLINNGSLAIDVDMATGESDKIQITGEEKDNKATINLNSIIVRKDLQENPGVGEINKENYVTVIDGKFGNINLNIDSVKTATTDYIYTFTKGNDGKLNVTTVRTGTFADFIPGTQKYADVNSYTLTEDKVIEKDLGTTYRAGNDKVITLAFNADKKLSGDNKAYTGAIVDEGYTLRLQGEDDKTPGVMTQFKTAATVKENGALEVENMKFVDNDHDIINNGTLKLSGGNTINGITNEGTAELEGNNAITTVSGTGKFDVVAGETTVSGELTQSTVYVSGGTLSLKDTIVESLTVETEGALEVGGNLKISHVFFNNGIVNLKSNNTITAVTGKGTIKVEAEKVTVDNFLTQNAVEVNAGSVLELNGGTYIGGTLTNAGTISLNGSENEINALNNTGTANLNGSQNTYGIITGEGALNVSAGVTTVKGAMTQGNAVVASGVTLNLDGDSKIIDTLNNAGTVSLKGSENELGGVIGEGAFNVEAGTTTVNGAFAQKTVNVSGGELELKAPKDSFLAGEVQGHAANITSSKVTGHVYGGLSVDNAHENNVNITKSTVNGDVYGGVSYNGNAYKNTVNISGETTVTGDVYGALAINNGTAYANTVNISGGTIKGNVYGGINEYGDNNTHHDNVINISGGKVEGTIYGASNKVEANNLLHVTGSNTKPVEVGNIAYLQKLEFTMPQGYDRRNALLTLTGTEATSLNLNGDKSVVLNSSPEERLVTGERVTLIQKAYTENEKNTLEIMDNGNSIFKDDGTMYSAYSKNALYISSPLYILKGKLELAALTENGKTDNIKNDLIFVAGKNILDRDEEDVKPEPKPEPKPDPQPTPKPDITPQPIVPGGDDKPQPIIPVDPEPQPEPKPVDPVPKPTPKPQPQPIDYDKVYSELMDNVKTALETRANGAALLNEAGDFLMKQGLSNAKMAAEANKAEGESSMAPFVALGGGKLRYETGSHVDSKSWHGAVGLAKQVNGLTFGVAIQQGKSNYDAYVNKAHSEGTSKSVGGALFAEKKIANGLHFDAAVRAGRVKNDYSANVTYSIPGENAFNVRYNESSAFYGISLGGGKEFTLKTKDKVDVYGRYAWTHTGSSEATTNWKDELKFDGINSHRILLGSRYTHAVNERNELYAGLGWQYELGGKVKGSIYGYSAPEPSLKGSSGLLELGWKAAAEENMTVDLNLSGWTGKQRGVMAGVNMQWKF